MVAAKRYYFGLEGGTLSFTKALLRTAPSLQVTAHKPALHTHTNASTSADELP